MNWEEVSAIGQVLGSIAVFITLGYLAVQLRHSRAEVRRSITQARAGSTREMAMHTANNEKLQTYILHASAALGGAGGPGGPPFVAELMERTGLSAEGAFTIFWNEMAWWYTRTQQIPYLEELPAGERAAFEGGIRGNYRIRPLGRLWLESTKDQLNPDAVRYVDNLLAQPG
jgi:hypothetical protein